MLLRSYSGVLKAACLSAAMVLGAVGAMSIWQPIKLLWKVRTGRLEIVDAKLSTLSQLEKRRDSDAVNAVPLGTIRRGVLLVYNTDCPACALNVVNWLRLRTELARNIPDSRTAVLSVEADSTDARHWAAFKNFNLEHWQLRPGASAASALGIKGWPATLVIRNDSIVATIMGPVGPRRRAEVVAMLSAGSAQ